MLGSLFGLLIVVGAVWAALFSPALAVREVVVEGNQGVESKDILAAASVPELRPLPRIDVAGIAQRVAAILPIAEASVVREYPSTLRIEVRERVAVAFVDEGDGSHLIDEHGIDFASAPPPPGLARLDVAEPKAGNAETMAALTVLHELDPALRGQVRAVGAETVSSVRLELNDDRIVLWGNTSRGPQKAKSALALLSQPGRIYDVSSPDLATIK